MRPFTTILVAACVLATPVTASAQDAYCTLDQSVYGSEDGEFNGVPVPVLLDDLITQFEPLVIGMPGRSITFLDGSEAAIIAGLSAVSRPALLPDGLGDVVIDATCELPSEFPATKRGKFKNSLLGGTVALSLNTRLDPDLFELEVCRLLMTTGVYPGADGLYGTEDDLPGDPTDSRMVYLPDEVMAALSDTLWFGVTVGDILDLANLKLAGQDTLPDVTPRLVAEAVEGVNSAFESCRFLHACVNEIIEIKLAVPTGGAGGNDRSAAPEPPDSKVFLHSASPVSDAVSIHYGLPEPGHVRLSVYNVAGREVDVFVDGDVYMEDNYIQVPVGPGRLPSGVYFLRLVATGLETGTGYTRTNKMLVLR